MSHSLTIVLMQMLRLSHRVTYGNVHQLPFLPFTIKLQCSTELLKTYLRALIPTIPGSCDYYRKFSHWIDFLSLQLGTRSKHPF